MVTSLATRRIEAELLDSLPAADPRAIRSRRDLALINKLMFQAPIMAGFLRAQMPVRRARILEIGCGDGSFMLSVARRLRQNAGDVDIILLDQADLVTAARVAAFAALGWRVETVTADVCAFVDKPGIGGFDIISANLFLHHFPDLSLQALFKSLRRLAPVVVAAEPRRTRIAVWATGLLRAIGANAVSRHDAAASVRAGFFGRELSRLWPQECADQIEERGIGPFTHVFCVTRAEGRGP
ncbi:MAG: methyltransferase domain-containing protein [Methylocella sp.]